VPHVFDRFYRADGGVASGSGLGLAIARELVQMMGGTVALDTSPEGTTVRVALGAAPTSIAAAAKGCSRSVPRWARHGRTRPWLS
jgi:signal transduction histidine kinase